MKFGLVTIRVPNYSNTAFEIFEDLASLFNLEYQSEAVLELKSKIEKQAKK